MKFSRDIVVQWYDTDAARTVSASRMMVYMMETANVQCSSYGFGLDSLRDTRGLGFVLGGIQASFKKPLYCGDSITVHTWCREARGFSFIRFFEIERQGEIVAEASSTWALLDITNKTMIKGDENYDCFFPIDSPLDPASLPRRARAPKAPLSRVGERRIVYSDVDYNMHMNNTRYPDMICDFIPHMIGRRLSNMSLTFVREAPLGCELSVLLSDPVQCESGDEYQLRTLDPEGNVCLEAAVTVCNI